jgi:flagellar basal body P-ring formation protein FlgA
VINGARLVSLMIGAVVALLARTSFAQSSIELKSSARVQPGAAVTLAEVATLSGDDAIALASVNVLPEGAGRPSKLSIQDLRRILSTQASVNWGRITMRGSMCVLAAPAPAPKAAPTAFMPQTSAAIDPNSVRRAVADRIARIVQAEAASLRLTFDTGDDEILNQSVTGRTLEIKPTASSDRLPLALTLYEGDRIVISRSIRVAVLVRKTVVIAAVAKSRGEAIGAGDVTIDEQWVGPNLKSASPDAVIGSAAQGRIATGQIIGVGDVSAPLVVSKGEQVAVSCVSGSVVLTTKARALTSGRVGDVVTFQGLEDKRTFTARMSGKGRAVVTADASPTEASKLEIHP